VSHIHTTIHIVACVRVLRYDTVKGKVRDPLTLPYCRREARASRALRRTALCFCTARDGWIIDHFPSHTVRAQRRDVLSPRIAPSLYIDVYLHMHTTIHRLICSCVKSQHGKEIRDPLTLPYCRRRARASRTLRRTALCRCSARDKWIVDHFSSHTVRAQRRDVLSPRIAPSRTGSWTTLT
jgi:hypothetical protein